MRHLNVRAQIDLRFECDVPEDNDLSDDDLSQQVAKALAEDVQDHLQDPLMDNFGLQVQALVLTGPAHEHDTDNITPTVIDTEENLNP